MAYDQQLANCEAKLTECIGELDATREALSETAAQLAERTRERDDADRLRMKFQNLAHERGEERDEARAESARLREALDEREADMHMRIRSDYDKTVPDCWRAKVAKLEEALRFYADGENWKVQRYEHAGVNAVRNRDGSWAGLPVMHDNGDRARQALAKENERGE